MSIEGKIGYCVLGAVLLAWLNIMVLYHTHAGASRLLMLCANIYVGNILCYDIKLIYVSLADVICFGYCYYVLKFLYISNVYDFL